MFRVVVLHHPLQEHRDGFASFLHRVIDAVRDAPGLTEFTALGCAVGAAGGDLQMGVIASI